MKITTEWANGYRQADADNSAARIATLEAITEARRAAADPTNDKGTRAHWNQKAERWQANLDQTTRAVRRWFDGTNEKAPRKMHSDVVALGIGPAMPPNCAQ